MQLYFFDDGLKKALQEYSVMMRQSTKEDNFEKIVYSDWRKLQTICENSAIKATFRGENYWDFEVAGSDLITTMALPDAFQRLMTHYSAPTERKETTMTTPRLNFDFGPMSTDAVAISPYGLAVRKPATDTWLTYNVATNQTVDVTGFTFDFEGMIYKMPAAVSSIAPGDMVLHQNRPMYVVDTANGIQVVDILGSETKTIIPVTNMFGFNFVTKIVSFINLGNTAPSPDQPFGNLMPMMMMSSMMNGNSDMDFGKMMMFSMMMGNGNPFANMFNIAEPQV